MTAEWDGHPSKGLIVKRGQSVFVDEVGRVHDRVITQGCRARSAGMGSPSSSRTLTPRHDQDIVIDTAGVAYNVRLHLTKHLHTIQRVEKLEATIVALQEKLSYQQRTIHDLRKEQYVTRGAFEAAQLCKADRGVVQFQRAKLDRVCGLLVAAGVLGETVGDGLTVPEEQRYIRQQYQHQQRQREEDHRAVVERKLQSAVDEISRINRTADAAVEMAANAENAAVEAKSQADAASRALLENDERAAAASLHYSQLDRERRENSRRIEANSTRIFQLAANVERVAEATPTKLHYGLAVESSNRRPLDSTKLTEVNVPGVDAQSAMETDSSAEPLSIGEQLSPKGAGSTSHSVFAVEIADLDLPRGRHHRGGVLTTEYSNEEQSISSGEEVAPHLAVPVRPSEHQPRSKEATRCLRPRMSCPVLRGAEAAESDFSMSGKEAKTRAIARADVDRSANRDSGTPRQLTRGWSMPILGGLPTPPAATGKLLPKEGRSCMDQEVFDRVPSTMFHCAAAAKKATNTVHASGRFDATDGRQRDDDRTDPAEREPHHALPRRPLHRPARPRSVASDEGSLVSDSTRATRLVAKGGRKQEHRGATLAPSHILAYLDRAGISGSGLQPRTQPSTKTPTPREMGLSNETNFDAIGSGFEVDPPEECSVSCRVNEAVRVQTRGEAGNDGAISVVGADATSEAVTRLSRGGERAASRPFGSRLTSIEGAPTLWCPRDTWSNAESLSIDGSNSNTGAIDVVAASGETGESNASVRDFPTPDDVRDDSVQHSIEVKEELAGDGPVFDAGADGTPLANRET